MIPGIEDFIRDQFERYYTMSFENYPVDMRSACMACRWRNARICWEGYRFS